MAPIVLCLLCFAAVALWFVYSTMSGIRALITASMEMLIYIVYALLGFAIAYLCFNFVIILFTDISVLWDLIKEFFSSLGGFWGVVAIIVGLALVGFICGLLSAVVAIIGPILFYIAVGALTIVYVVFEFIEDKSRYGYSIVVTKIANRLVKNQGGSK